MRTTPASGAGVRRPWADLPAPIRHELEALLGAPVVDAVTQPGGFSPGVAARLRLADGRRAFVKAVGPTPNPDSPAIHRAEARVAAHLPSSAPVPALLGSVDRDGWVALAFADVDGEAPRLPWRPAELARVLDALTDLAAALTPPPLRAPGVAERFDPMFRGWRDLAAARDAGQDDLTGLDPWALRHLDRLAAREAGWAAAAAGDCLAHADVRADNLLLRPEQVVFVDWPWACVAAPWFDLLAMLPSVAMQGGPAPWELFDEHPLGRAADRQAVTTVLTALAGFFVSHGRRPAPPGLPTLRAFQREQGIQALAWLKHRWRAAQPAGQ